MRCSSLLTDTYSVVPCYNALRTSIEIYVSTLLNKQDNIIMKCKKVKFKQCKFKLIKLTII